ncbi:MAG: PspC domain-containing protein [Bacteroidales bacterium]|nr:PspC domain-containing protein [Candidatus Colicola coprequi]
MEKKLTKSTDKKLAGVCTGLAEYFGLDATLVRVLYVVLTVFSAGFPGIVLYIIMTLIMPEKTAE